MEEYLKIRDFLFNFKSDSYDQVDSIGELFEILEAQQQLSTIINCYGDEFSVSCSPEFAVFREKYTGICC